MKIKINLILLLFFTTWSVLAQNSITGSVSDATTGSPLEGAHVVVRRINAGTTADAAGMYRIAGIGPGKYTVVVSFVGYAADSAVVYIKQDSATRHNFRLQVSGVEMPSVVITATRTYRAIRDIPARVALLDRREVQDFPATDVDDALQSISNVYVNRSWGIFSKNTSVTMRGLDGTSRTLVLLNGVPLNKVSGGQIQWALIRPEDVQRIEVIKGPGSALYGMNAMGGVINVITQKPRKDLQLRAELQGGLMNTFGGNFAASKDESEGGRGFYWGVNSFYRQGDGYVIEPLASRDSTDTKAYLREGNASALLGYHFNKNQKLEISYEYHDEKKGDGRQVFEDDGGYNRYQIQYIRASYNGMLGGATLSANAFTQIENYDRQSETVNSTGVYRLYRTDSYKADEGLWMTLSKAWFAHNLVTVGMDLRNGSVNSKDIYLTSTDEIRYKGKLSFAGIFAQDEITMVGGKIRLVAGARIDVANYRDGSLQVTDPTSTTGFPQQESNRFDGNTWTSFSPKLSGLYAFNQRLSTYVSFSTGFNPPKLDDLSKSGKISKGFKLANPELTPETINTWEWGLNWQPVNGLHFEPSVYFSRGNNFQYFVPTGDSIDTGGSSLKPVLRRENISRVEIAGVEVNLKWQATKNLLLSAWYAYNHSVVSEYKVTDEVLAQTLEGKFLAEVPRHTAFASLQYLNKIVNPVLTCNYVGKMWADEYNTTTIEAYWMFDVNLWKQITPHWRASLIVQDIFDRQPIDKKLRLSPGRFFMGKLQYKL